MGSPRATASTARPHVGDRINRATRPVHARLNKSILERLPQALPPHAANPSIYASGLLHVAPIYLVFESLWKNLICSDNTTTTTSETNPPFLNPAEVSLFPSSYSHTAVPTDAPTCPPHIRAVLTHLHLPRLLRSPSLHSDLRAITGWSPSELSTQLRLAATTGRLSQFIEHTKRSVARHPHVLLAYAWVLYMALFSGGRFLRASLEDAGPAFWENKPDPIAPGGFVCCEPAGAGEMPLSFFRFATAEDGEDLKREFKIRLGEAEANLSEHEADDVVREAICLFDNIVLLVGQLDGVCGGEVGFTTRPSQSVEEGWAAALMPKFLGGGIRDSLAVARERGLKGVGRTGRKAPDCVSATVDEKNEQEKVMSVELLEKKTTDDTKAGPVKTVRFGSGAQAVAVEDGDKLDDGRLRYAFFSSIWNPAVIVGIVGVAWGLGQVSR